MPAANHGALRCVRYIGRTDAIVERGLTGLCRFSNSRGGN
jgi:hypothetical protein